MYKCSVYRIPKTLVIITNQNPRTSNRIENKLFNLPDVLIFLPLRNTKLPFPPRIRIPKDTPLLYPWIVDQQLLFRKISAPKPEAPKLGRQTLCNQTEGVHSSGRSLLNFRFAFVLLATLPSSPYQLNGPGHQTTQWFRFTSFL